MLTAPKGATHFKLILSASLLSDYAYNTTIKKHQPINYIDNASYKAVASTPYPLNALTPKKITLIAKATQTKGPIPETMSLITAIGIIFYQQINNQLFELSSSNALRLEQIA